MGLTSKTRFPRASALPPRVGPTQWLNYPTIFKVQDFHIATEPGSPQSWGPVSYWAPSSPPLMPPPEFFHPSSPESLCDPWPVHVFRPLSTLIDRSAHSLTPFPTRLPASRGPCQSFRAVLPTLRTRHPAPSMVQGTWSMNMSYLVDWLVGCMNTGEEEGRPSLLLNPESLPQPWITASGQYHFPGI